MSQMRIRSLFALMCSVVFAGCQVPDYKLPGGFSSTYSRALRSEENLLSPDADFRESVIQREGVFYPQTFRFDPPTKSPFEQAVLVPQSSQIIRRR